MNSYSQLTYLAKQEDVLIMVLNPNLHFWKYSYFCNFIGNIPKMMRKLLQEHLVFTKDVYTYYFNDARKNGVLAIENNKGKAKLDMGIYYLNDVPKPNVKMDDVYSILWRLIHKYKVFNYSPHRFRTNLKYYEYEPESKTWEVYNRPAK